MGRQEGRVPVMNHLDVLRVEFRVDVPGVHVRVPVVPEVHESSGGIRPDDDHLPRFLLGYDLQRALGRSGPQVGRAEGVDAVPAGVGQVELADPGLVLDRREVEDVPRIALAALGNYVGQSCSVAETKYIKLDFVCGFAQ